MVAVLRLVGSQRLASGPIDETPVCRHSSRPAVSGGHHSQDRPGPRIAYRSNVPRWEVFKAVAQTVSEVLPHDALIVSVEVSEDSSLVTLRTLTPGIVIGRRGTVAEGIRDALRASVGPQVYLRIEEVKDPPDDGPLGGVREPRSPFPNEPLGLD